MFAGGEFYYEDRWMLDTPTVSHFFPTKGYFLNGGVACLTIIADYLLDHGITQILLPTYLCPSILTTFEHCGVGFDFYQVNEDFSIDLDDLARKITEYKAVLFINYFGFLYPPAVRQFFKDLQQNGILVVEDNAQAGFHDHPTGDFILNSLRKFTAYDGGYLITRFDVTPYFDRYRRRPNRRLALIRDYRERLRNYLFEDAGDPDELEEIYHRAESYYDTDQAVLGDPQEREHIERLDWQGIKQVRRDNYQYLLDLLPSIPGILPVFPALQDDNMPLGLPVYFTSVSRDRVYDELGHASIGLPVHWDEIRTNLHTCRNRTAVEMASKILTLVIDQRTTRKQIDYLALNLVRGIEVARSISCK